MRQLGELLARPGERRGVFEGTRCAADGCAQMRVVAVTHLTLSPPTSIMGIERPEASVIEPPGAADAAPPPAAESVAAYFSIIASSNVTLGAIRSGLRKDAERPAAHLEGMATSSGNLRVTDIKQLHAHWKYRVTSPDAVVTAPSPLPRAATSHSTPT